MTPSQVRWLTIALRCFGLIDCLAVAVVFIPRAWIHAMHQELGLTPFPSDPIAGYLARSASVMYALHGVTILYLSRDVIRYEGLIRFLAYIALAHGTILFWIDWIEGMPTWWTWAEGPLFAASGVLVLLIMRNTKSRPESISSPLSPPGERGRG